MVNICKTNICVSVDEDVISFRRVLTWALVTRTSCDNIVVVWYVVWGSPWLSDDPQNLLSNNQGTSYWGEFNIYTRSYSQGNYPASTYLVDLKLANLVVCLKD